MARNQIGGAERHFEKGVLVIALLFLGYMFVTYLLVSPSEEGGVTAGDLIDDTKDLADDLSRKLKTDVWPEVQDTIDFAETAEMNDVYLPVRPIVQFARIETFGEPGQPQTATLHHYELPKILPPEKLMVAEGRARAVVELEEDDRNNMAGRLERIRSQGTSGGKREDVIYVTVAAEFDLAAQWEEFAQGDLPAAKRLPPGADEFYFTSVDVQRQELQADGSFSEWHDVSLPESLVMYDPLPEKLLDENQQVLVQLQQTVKSDQTQMDILQPPFYEIVEGSGRWEPPKLPFIKQREKEEREAELGQGRDARQQDRVPKRRQQSAPRRPARRGGRGGMPGGMPGMRGMGAPGMGGGFGPGMPGEGMMPGGRRQPNQRDVRRPRAAQDDETPFRPFDGMAWTNVVEQENRFAIYQHDTSVTPDKTYRYRLRIRMLNPLLGHNNVPEDAPDMQFQVHLLSDWSKPSPEVAIPPTTQFYFVASRGDSATFEIYHWQYGRWQGEKFPTQLGLPVGGVKKVSVLDVETRKKEMREVDFSTGLALVDIHDDVYVERRIRKKIGGGGGEQLDFREGICPAAVLFSEQGKLDRRIMKADVKDKRLQDLRKRVRERAHLSNSEQ